jgi:site-specific DNA-methyltransferase (adenine-specific)
MACDRMIGPYPCCSIVQGDCLELMKAIPTLVCECGADVSGEGGLYHCVGGHKNRPAIDAVITDPPYGIAYNPSGGNGLAQRGNLPKVFGDNRPFDPVPFLGFKTVVLFGANHFSDKLPKSAAWLVWYKRDGVPSIAFGDCELAWSNMHGQSRVFNHFWHGMLRDSERGELRLHPTQKPVAVMEWIIGLTDSQTILDPFSGSGTTLVAAKKLGRHFLGFEISPEYCEIARKRLEAIDAQPSLFEPKPEQLSLGGE